MNYVDIIIEHIFCLKLLQAARLSFELCGVAINYHLYSIAGWKRFTDCSNIFPAGGTVFLPSRHPIWQAATAKYVEAGGQLHWLVENLATDAAFMLVSQLL